MNVRLLVCCAVLALSACAPKAESPVATAAPTAAAAAPRAQVDEARMQAVNDPVNAGQWLTHGRDYSEQRFSPLTRISADNVNQLGLAWFADFDTRRGQESRHWSLMVRFT
jgi:quinohemoprotein ethanol dehydrogenase